METGKLSKETGFFFFLRSLYFRPNFLGLTWLGATSIISHLILQTLSTESYKGKWLHMHSELNWDKQKLYSRTEQPEVVLALSLAAMLYLVSHKHDLSCLSLCWWLLKEQFLLWGIFGDHGGSLNSKEQSAWIRKLQIPVKYLT